MSKLNILLCDDHINKCEDGLFKTKHPEDEPCLMCVVEWFQKEAYQLRSRIDKVDNLIMSFGESIDVPLRNSLLDAVRGLQDL